MKKFILILTAVFAYSGSIFSDSNFSQPTNNFSPQQTVYVKLESFVNGDKEKTLRILDSEKREIQRLNLNRNDNIFTASFTAPDVSGVYYLDIKIKDNQGSVYSSQENINIGEVSGQSVSSEATAASNVGQQPVTEDNHPREEIQSTPELVAQEKVLPETPKTFFTQFLENLFGFLKKIFSFGLNT